MPCGTGMGRVTQDCIGQNLPMCTTESREHGKLSAVKVHRYSTDESDPIANTLCSVESLTIHLTSLTLSHINFSPTAASQDEPPTLGCYPLRSEPTQAAL
jgi:hypothetical protein